MASDEKAREAEHGGMTLADQIRQLIERMRSQGPRFQAQYGGLDVIYANDVDDWADEWEALLLQAGHGGESPELAELIKAVERWQANDAETHYYDEKDVRDAAVRFVQAVREKP